MSIKPIFFSGELGRQDKERLIFVEGTDDAYFLDAILDEIGADPEKVGVVIVGGTPKFGASILSYSKTSAFRRAKGVIAIRDADDDPVAAQNEIREAFQKAFKVTAKHAEIIVDNKIAYGIFILPSAGESGDLEKLCLDTVSGTHLHASAEKYIEQAREATGFGQIYKRTAQVFLAAIPDELCRGAGMGFRRGFFDVSHNALEPLKNFLNDFLKA